MSRWPPAGIAKQRLAAYARKKPVDLITFSAMHGARRGEVLRFSGRRYVVTKVVNSRAVAVRRTFWQWVMDIVMWIFR